MASPIQITVAARDPGRLAAFWAMTLGYVLEPPRPGYLVGGDGAGKEHYAAIVDPVGYGPRMLFQRVPQARAGKNRVHLDVNAGHGAKDRRAAVRARASQLVAAGATVVREMQEESGWWIVLTDPEGNEFCLQ